MRHLVRLAPYALVTVVYFALRLNALGGLIPYQRHEGLGPIGHVLNAFPLFAQYLGKLLVPAGMTIFYPFHPVRSALSQSFLTGLLATIVFAAAWWWTWRRHHATVNVALSLVAAPLLPVLYVSGVGESAFADRYLYVSSVGFVLLVALGASWLWRRQQLAPRALAVGATAVVLALYSAGTVERHEAWQTDLALWSDAAVKAPDAQRPIAAIAEYHYRAQRWADATTWYEKALEKGPAAPGILTNLGIAHARQRRYADAERCFQQALAIQPSDHRLHYDLGLVYSSQRRFDEAIARFEAALRIDPAFQKAASSLHFVRQAKAMLAR